MAMTMTAKMMQLRRVSSPTLRARLRIGRWSVSMPEGAPGDPAISENLAPCERVSPGGLRLLPGSEADRLVPGWPEPPEDRRGYHPDNRADDQGDQTLSQRDVGLEGRDQ
jgi:hypothetical protein